MKKKSFALIALSVALFSVPVVSVANAEVTNSNIAVSESATSQPEVVKAYITTESGLEEISLNEYQKLLSQEQPQLKFMIAEIGLVQWLILVLTLFLSVN